MRKRYQISLVMITLLLVCSIIIATSYAYWTVTETQEEANILSSGCFDASLEGNNEINLNNTYPMTDEEGLKTQEYIFTVRNTCTVDSSYQINLESLAETTLGSNYIKVSLNESTPKLLTDYSNASKIIADSIESKKIGEGSLKANESVKYSLRIWMDGSATLDQANLTFTSKIVVATQAANTYKESILNGADPVLGSLVPVTIADNGVVKKADIKSEWYKYEDKKWANAVILEDESVSYNNGEVIPEENIESYFVWIPRYKYKIFDEGNYTSLGTIDSSKPQVIDVVFESKDVEASTGSTVDSYLTHPAFTTLASNGIWVAKFETGYKGATTTEEAEVNESDTTKVEVKPNVYSWRNINVGNAFKTSYEYKRTMDSHMMKNTEWGAVAYLQHSAYGSADSVRINNNSAYITGYAATEEPTLGYNSGTSIDGNRVESTALNTNGTYTMMYNTSAGYLASTTRNITGIYDISGGAWEYVASGTTSGEIEISTLYPDFFTNNNWNKYYDRYTAVETTNWNNRILGDATGELGPFQSDLDPDGFARIKSSWYKSYGWFMNPSIAWLERGGNYDCGVNAGVFAFAGETGSAIDYSSYRIVLTP